ncbi:hypothetical protein WICPIJ_003995 [Wickerhamomyces pijperi]|uniref:Uncharacterized protein n=1 Tax=Wickerhamomyces pijperi TaxID=599730 RepID=A0A9P8Q6H3_WICPI|nr:hypothetical protein WICPIJ_003995 [Wickerhamomyces pijperi]
MRNQLSVIVNALDSQFFVQSMLLQDLRQRIVQPSDTFLVPIGFVSQIIKELATFFDRTTFQFSVTLDSNSKSFDLLIFSNFLDLISLRDTFDLRFKRLLEFVVDLFNFGEIVSDHQIEIFSFGRTWITWCGGHIFVTLIGTSSGGSNRGTSTLGRLKTWMNVHILIVGKSIFTALSAGRLHSVVIIDVLVVDESQDPAITVGFTQVAVYELLRVAGGVVMVVVWHVLGI